MVRKRLDKLALLEKLPRVEYSAGPRREQDRFEQASLAGVLLLLADISHESEYTVCRSLAEHLLGRVPEPDDEEPGAGG